MHGGITENVMGLLKVPIFWALSLLTFLVGATIAVFESTPTPVLLGVLSIIGGIVTGIVFRIIDQWNERRKERNQEKKEGAKTDLQREAYLALQQASLRQEEREYFNSVITRALEEERISSRRAHALSGELDRLRNNLLICIQMLGGKIPEGVLVFNPELHRYLAELEELPLPALAPKPKSLEEIHKSSSPDLPRIE